MNPNIKKKYLNSKYIFNKKLYHSRFTITYRFILVGTTKGTRDLVEREGNSKFTRDSNEGACTEPSIDLCRNTIDLNSFNTPVS